jgi:hypothetical protein
MLESTNMDGRVYIKTGTCRNNTFRRPFPPNTRTKEPPLNLPPPRRRRRHGRPPPPPPRDLWRISPPPSPRPLPRIAGTDSSRPCPLTTPTRRFLIRVLPFFGPPSKELGRRPASSAAAGDATAELKSAREDVKQLLKDKSCHPILVSSMRPCTVMEEQLHPYQSI